LPHADFARVNEERKARGEKLFANPRNAASGSVRQLDANVTAGRGLRFYAYSCPLLEDGALPAYSDVIDRLESLGFSTTRVSFEIFSDIERLIVRIGELTAHRPTLGFDIDGMVVKMNRIADWKRTGFTAHHPRYAIAYKFPAELARTRVADVLHSVGRSGIVTPVAILDATPIGGVTVGRATLHNYSELALKDVRIGDHAWLMRAGEVIPEIVSVIAEARDGSEIIVERPETCPVCGTTLANDEGKIAWYCPNRTNCPAQLQGGMEVFVGKHGMDIDGLGKKQIELFRKLGILSDFASIYHLREHRDTLLGQEGYKEKSVGNLLAAIETSREAKLENLLVAL
jgi:DNA ligase (NAD+)